MAAAEEDDILEDLEDSDPALRPAASVQPASALPPIKSASALPPISQPPPQATVVAVSSPMDDDDYSDYDEDESENELPQGGSMQYLASRGPPQPSPALSIISAPVAPVATPVVAPVRGPQPSQTNALVTVRPATATTGRPPVVPKAGSTGLAGAHLTAPAMLGVPAPARPSQIMSAPPGPAPIIENTPRSSMGEGRFEERARRNWQKFRHSMKFSPYDIVKALGAVPAGMCAGELASLLAKNKFSTEAVLHPSIHDNGLRIGDLEMDPLTGTLKALPCRALKISILEALDLPLAPQGLDIVSRGVNVCLHDKVNVLSNIYTVHCHQVDMEDPHHWLFSKKSSEHACIVRTSSTSLDLSLMLELFVTVAKKGDIDPATGRLKEATLTCGWTIIPLGKSAEHTEFKLHELELKGGTVAQPKAFDPADLGVPVSRLAALFGRKRQAMVKARLKELNRTDAPLAQQLPNNFVITSGLLHPITLYRQLLAEHLMLRANPTIIQPAVELTLEVFPRLCNDDHLAHAFISIWETRWDEWTFAQRDEPKFLREQLQAITKLLYPLLYTVNLKSDNRQLRNDTMHTFLMQKPEMALCRDEIVYEPFDLDEIVFDAARRYHVY